MKYQLCLVLVACIWLSADAQSQALEKLVGDYTILINPDRESFGKPPEISMTFFGDKTVSNVQLKSTSQNRLLITFFGNLTKIKLKVDCRKSSDFKLSSLKICLNKLEPNPKWTAKVNRVFPKGKITESVFDVQTIVPIPHLKKNTL